MKRCLNEKVWVMQYPQPTTRKVMAHKVSSLTYGCAHTHNAQQGTVQLCCLFTVSFIYKIVLFLENTCDDVQLTKS